MYSATELSGVLAIMLLLYSLLPTSLSLSILGNIGNNGKVF